MANFDYKKEIRLNVLLANRLIFTCKEKFKDEKEIFNHVKKNVQNFSVIIAVQNETETKKTLTNVKK